MAAYIPVPRDLTKVKSKIFFNLTKRQLICFGAGALLGVPSFFLLKRIGSTSLAAMGMILIMLPMFLLAMYERDGQPLEVIAKHFIETKFIRPKVRPYQTDNYYEVLLRISEAEKEVDKIVSVYDKTKSPAVDKLTVKPVKKGPETRSGGHRPGKEK
ncbi:MAG: PrgI family protein [Lachnospiraceae bacterium]|nr:PrgI family protein [Lachnospiraceae bacterium]